jgi:acetylornithine deacetylase/succinyl-diaminopimelate desuccinylase-like protein
MELFCAHQDAHIAKQIEIGQIPAPGFHEEVRAAALVKEFRRIGLADIEIDPIGNALGWYRGSSPRALVLAAHLDTVFPADTDVTVKRVGSRLNGPGIYDDTRGLIALLFIAEAIQRAQLAMQRSILFVCDVGEQGLGSLRGSRYLFREGKYRDFSTRSSPSTAMATEESSRRRWAAVATASS